MTRPPSLAPDDESVKLRTLARRETPTYRCRSVIGLTVPVRVLDRLGWEAGEQMRLHATRSGRLVAQRVDDDGTNASS